MSLNNEKNCREISEDKIAVCEKTAGLQSAAGNFGFELSAFESVIVPVKIFQIFKIFKKKFKKAKKS
jgi:hypothetical protein